MRSTLARAPCLVAVDMVTLLEGDVQPTVWLVAQEPHASRSDERGGVDVAPSADDRRPSVHAGRPRGPGGLVVLATWLLIFPIAFGFVRLTQQAGMGELEELSRSGVNVTATVDRTEYRDHSTIYYSYVYGGRGYSASQGLGPPGLVPGGRVTAVVGSRNPTISCLCQPAADLRALRTDTWILGSFLTLMITMLAVAGYRALGPHSDSSSTVIGAGDRSRRRARCRLVSLAAMTIGGCVAAWGLPHHWTMVALAGLPAAGGYLMAAAVAGRARRGAWLPFTPRLIAELAREAGLPAAPILAFTYATLFATIVGALRLGLQWRA